MRGFCLKVSELYHTSPKNKWRPVLACLHSEGQSILLTIAPLHNTVPLFEGAAELKGMRYRNYFALEDSGFVSISPATINADIFVLSEYPNIAPSQTFED